MTDHPTHIFLALCRRELPAYWEEYQRNKSLQQNFTPIDLTKKMVEKIPRKLSDKDVIVIANFETYLFFIAMRRNNEDGYNYKSLTLFTDVTGLDKTKWHDGDIHNIIVENYSSVATLNINMKFDVVIGNPPYNDDSTTDDTTGRRRGSPGGLFVDFINNSFIWCKHGGSIAIISPSRRFMVGRSRNKNLPKYMKHGLTSVTNVDKYFDIDIKGVCLYMFINGAPQTSLQHDDLDPTYAIPSNNLSKYHHRSSSAKRGIVESLERDDAGSKVYCTTSVIIYVKDPKPINDRYSNCWRVIFNANACKTKIGKILVASPGEYVSGSVNYMVVKSEDEAHRIKDLLESESSKQIQAAVRVSPSNSAYHMSFIEDLVN